MRDDMELAGLAESTRDVYVRNALVYVNHFCRPPGRMGREEVRSFLLHLMRMKQYAAATVIVYAAAIRFLYAVTLGRPEVMAGIRLPSPKRRRIVVPTRDEVRRILDAAHSEFHRTVLLTSYAAGLRCMEVTALRVEDIDSVSNLLHVRKDKGDKPRTTVLGPALLGDLRAHYRRYLPPLGWLFPARAPSRRFEDRPMPPASASKAFTKAAKRAGVRRGLTPGRRHWACRGWTGSSPWATPWRRQRWTTRPRSSCGRWATSSSRLFLLALDGHEQHHHGQREPGVELLLRVLGRNRRVGHDKGIPGALDDAHHVVADEARHLASGPLLQSTCDIARK